MQAAVVGLLLAAGGVLTGALCCFLITFPRAVFSCVAVLMTFQWLGALPFCSEGCFLPHAHGFCHEHIRISTQFSMGHAAFAVVAVLVMLHSGYVFAYLLVRLWLWALLFWTECAVTA